MLVVYILFDEVVGSDGDEDGVYELSND